MNDLLKFITCGSVDDGKSTLIGHILYDAKLLFADQEKALMLDSKVGSSGGAIDYSLLLDGLMAEREQGITIDVAYRYFTTDHRSFIVADTPGHEEYTRNMAVGASFADLAVILLDATKGVLVQTRRHARICALMGINYFVFAINKMDLADYREDTFRGIAEQIRELAEELQLKNVKIIPVSAREGDNITKSSENMPWYEGEPILEYLENVDVTEHEEKGFYLPIQRVCRPDHTFRGFQGQVESGEIRTGEEVTVLPSREKAHIKEILVGDRSADQAVTDQPVTVTLDREVDVSRGSVLTRGADIGTARSFLATILWMDDTVLEEGRDFFVRLGTRKIAGRVKEIIYKTDINTGDKVKVMSLVKNEIALCSIVLDEEIPVDLFRKHRTLGELILIDRISNMTSACGVVEELTDEEDDSTRVEKGEHSARISLFDEYFYNEKHSGVDNIQAQKQIYQVGDTFPLSGESYQYPPYFDILALPTEHVVQIRDGRVFDVIPLSEYQFIGLPTVNENGFSIRIKSADDLKEFLADFRGMDQQKFMEKWMRFETYRRVIFNSNNWVL
ncbi:MAG TPA: sulfate adenylyltransferase [Lachnospiraceae bacterium]|nr:sulfate adenylyltransferase [Lachnospiraceae bacterium]